MRIEAAVFAYNESRTIRRAVDSLLRGDRVDRVTVLVNGCTDNTAEIVNQMANEDRRIHPVHVKAGDKCNVWNRYVHEIADQESDLQLFMDGDCFCDDDAVQNFASTFANDPEISAIAAVPFSGRNRQSYIDLQHRLRWLFGNLYAVSMRQIRSLREHGVCLPIGLKGNDHFITKIMQTDFASDQKRTPERVSICDSAGYRFDSLQPYRPSDLKSYWGRIVTYDLRQRQIPILNPLRITELPETVDEVNQAILGDLRNRTLLSPAPRATRAKLKRMYPHRETKFYGSKFRLPAASAL